MPGRTIALTLLICALWASVGIAIKLSLADAPPLGLAAVRMAVAAAALWMWMRVQRHPERDWKHGRAVLIATAFYSLLLAATHIGFDHTSAARGIVLLNTTPLFVALFAHCIAPRESLGVARAMGLAVAFAGVFTIFARGFGSGGSVPGHIVMVLAAVFWSLHTVWIKRAARDVDPAALTLTQFIGSAVVLGFISVASEPAGLWRPGLPLMAGIVYLALPGTALAWLLWARVLSQVPAGTASAFIFSVPLMGMGMGWLVLGEPITAQFVVGACLISLGIAAVVRAPGTSRASASRRPAA